MKEQIYGTKRAKMLLKIYNRKWKEKQIQKDWQRSLIDLIY